MTTCSACRHWLPKETPRWAVRLQMACCAKKHTKAVTLAHWTTCRQHQQADEGVVAARVVWLKPADPVSQTTKESH